MKKFLLAFLIGMATLAATSSCTKEYYDIVPSITMVYERTASQWQRNSSNQIYIDLNVPELTSYYVNQGIVNLAISFDNENTYNAIPATIEAVSYSYDYATGSVRIYAEDPILESGISIDPPAHIFVKISLTEADYVQ